MGACLLRSKADCIQGWLKWSDTKPFRHIPYPKDYWPHLDLQMINTPENKAQPILTQTPQNETRPSLPVLDPTHAEAWSVFGLLKLQAALWLLPSPGPGARLHINTVESRQIWSWEAEPASALNCTEHSCRGRNQNEKDCFCSWPWGTPWLLQGDGAVGVTCNGSDDLFLAASVCRQPKAGGGEHLWLLCLRATLDLNLCSVL